MIQKSLPDGFCDTVNGKVKAMADGKKGMEVAKKIVLDLEVIYARALALWHINPDLYFEKLLVYELAPDRTSVFNEKGVIHPCNQKSKVMAGLMVEVSGRKTRCFLFRWLCYLLRWYFAK